jgi:hypothetical protein
MGLKLGEESMYLEFKHNPTVSSLLLATLLLSACGQAKEAPVKADESMAESKAQTDKVPAPAKEAALDLKDCKAEKCAQLGTNYFEGQGGVSKDSAMARAYYDKACNSGHLKSCGILGFIYAKGVDVDKDNGKAWEYFGKVCDGGMDNFCTAPPVLPKI